MYYLFINLQVLLSINMHQFKDEQLFQHDQPDWFGSRISHKLYIQGYFKILKTFHFRNIFYF
jgi:hypothetical protein